MCTAFFKSRPFSVTYIHTVVLETLIDNVKLKFFYLSVFWNYYTYTYRFFDNIYQTVCEKRPSTPWLSSKAFTFDHSLDHRSSFRFLQQFDNFFWTEWPENHKNRCLSSSTNRVDLHFHEGVEKIKENVKNTKIENLQNEQEKYGGKNLADVYSWGKHKKT